MFARIAASLLFELSRSGFTALTLVRVVQLLGDAIELLPRAETDLTVEDFADAQSVTPTEMDPIALLNHGIGQLHEATQLRCVARTAPPQYVEAIHEYDESIGISNDRARSTGPNSPVDHCHSMSC